MSIKNPKDYQTYRLDQLEQLKAQGMDVNTYLKEVERVENFIDPLLSLDSTNGFKWRVGERETLEIDLPQFYPETTKINR